jgi:TRAP-type mannitol/chloroaromatic compound transport system permease large subunit
MRGLAPREITIVDIYRSIWPFVIMMMLTIAVVMAFPEMAMIVPHAMR